MNMSERLTRIRETLFEFNENIQKIIIEDDKKLVFAIKKILGEKKIEENWLVDFYYIDKEDAPEEFKETNDFLGNCMSGDVYLLFAIPPSGKLLVSYVSRITFELVLAHYDQVNEATSDQTED